MRRSLLAGNMWYGPRTSQGQNAPVTHMASLQRKRNAAGEIGGKDGAPPAKPVSPKARGRRPPSSASPILVDTVAAPIPPNHALRCEDFWGLTLENKVV